VAVQIRRNPRYNADSAATGATGLEPATSGVTAFDHRAGLGGSVEVRIQAAVDEDLNAPGWIRTSGLPLRRRTLSPAELPGQGRIIALASGRSLGRNKGRNKSGHQRL
jgi:hypothetical protein